jgi:CheY-like chemotaxis protein
MDHMMPKMDGMEAARQIRAMSYTHPIVALTANAVVGQSGIFLENGFDCFISKPIDTRQLNSTLNRMIRDKQPPEVLEKARSSKPAAPKAPQTQAAAGDMVAPELLAVFALDANRALPVLESAAGDMKDLSDDALRAFIITVHSMKSALMNIRETRLSQMAYALEKAGKSSDMEAIAARINAFIKALRGVTAKAEVESKQKDCASEDESPEILREQLHVIAKACREYDETAVTEALKILKKMSWTEETEQLLDKISEHILVSNFEEAADTAEGGAR